MKITQECATSRRKQNAGVESFVAAEEVEAGMAGVGMYGTDMETGFAHMSAKFRETGSELYMGQGDREHD